MSHQKPVGLSFLGKARQILEALALDVEIGVGIGRGNLPIGELETSSKTTPHCLKTPYASPKKKKQKKKKRELYSHPDLVLPFYIRREVKIE